MTKLNPRYLLTGLVLAAFLAGGIFIIRKNRPVVSISAVQGATLLKSKGPEQAPVEIVEYSDFQCPACRAAEPVIDKIMAAYPDKIHFLYRHFPLQGHRWSGISHQAGECAHRQGKFWEFHKKLYDDQAVWSISNDPAPTFLSYARDLGLSLDAFAACLSDDSVRRQIQEEKIRGDALQVNSTPTFFINGERIVGPIELENKGQEVIRKILGLPPLPAAPAPPAAPSEAPQTFKLPPLSAGLQTSASNDSKAS